MQVAAPLQAAGSLVQGFGGFQAGRANAAAAKENARQDELEGAAEAERLRSQARASMGEEVGAQAESGFTPGTGTALTSLREAAINSELDIMNTRRKAATAAAANRQKAAMAKQAGLMAAVGGVTGAAGALAGGKSDYAQQSSAYGVGKPSSSIKVVVPGGGPSFSRK